MKWQRVKLGDVCNIEKGKTGIKTAQHGDYPMITLSEKFITHQSYQFDSEAVIIPLVSSTGHGHASIKRLHYFNGKFALGSILCAILSKNDEDINLKFLYLYLTLLKDDIIVPMMKGSANVSLSISKIKEIQIILPPKELQDKIYLDHFFFKKANEEIKFRLTKQQTLIKKLKQSYLSEAIRGELVPQDPDDEPATKLLTRIKAEKEAKILAGELKKSKPLKPILPEEIPFDIPTSWAWCRLGELGIGRTGTTPPTEFKKYFGRDIPFIKPADITLKSINYDNYGLSFEGSNFSTTVPKNSLMMVCIGGSIGKSFTNNRNVCFNQQINSITPMLGIDSKFLQQLLQSQYFQKLIWKNAGGGTTPIINRLKWESLLIPLPPLAEQARIVARLNELMAVCDSLESQCKLSLESSKELLQVVLKEMLEG